MKRKLTRCITGVVAILIVQTPASARNRHYPRPTAQQSQVEEIYIARSLRESRGAPTEFCREAKTGFKSTIEDEYSFQATATRPSDGRMTNTNVGMIGSGRGCLGQIANTAIYNFYLDLRLGKTALRGIGDCRLTKSDFPEQGLTAFQCFLDLSDTAGRYVGGQLTTNTMGSRKVVGADSDPPGYTQPSIATIRLWKKRMDR